MFVIANPKGGVGKTTTAVHVATAMSGLGRAVLVVDLDPQAGATWSFGYDPDAVTPTLHEVVVGRARLVETVLEHAEVDLVPADPNLAGAEASLLSRTGREFLLRDELADLRDSYDVVMIDCPPSLGVLTVNGLAAADELVIPVQCEPLSRYGAAQLLRTVDDVRQLANPDLLAHGLVITRFDADQEHDRLGELPDRPALPVIGPPVSSWRWSAEPRSTAGPRSTVEPRSTRDDEPPGLAAYREIARRLLGYPPDPELLAVAERRPLVREDARRARGG